MKIQKNFVEVEIDGALLRITGEAMMSKSPHELTKHIL